MVTQLSHISDRFELSVESHSIPSIAKPVETINHRVVARQLERAYTSPGQIGGLRDSPVQFTLGGDDDILMGVSSSATPDLLGHVMHPAIMMNNRQPDIDVGSINESTSSGEANEEKPPHLKVILCRSRNGVYKSATPIIYLLVLQF